MALHAGGTVRDVAAGLHNELAETVRSARVWGPSARYPGQRVGRMHVVADGDLLELDTTER
jgi:ribosome-interacting GTPase 1